MDKWKDGMQPREIHSDAEILVRTKGFSLLSSLMTQKRLSILTKKSVGERAMPRTGGWGR